MPVKTGPYLDTKEVFIDYPFEEVMFRREPIKGQIYRKFYGELESPDPIPYDNRLYCDALRFGDEISCEIYEAGKPK